MYIIIIIIIMYILLCIPCNVVPSVSFICFILIWVSFRENEKWLYIQVNKNLLYEKVGGI